MDESRYKGKIKNVSSINSGYVTYERATPGITLPSDSMTPEELAAMSGVVTTTILTSPDPDEDK